MACSLRKFIRFVLDLLQGAESITGDKVFQLGLVETIPGLYIICRGLQTIL